MDAGTKVVSVTTSEVATAAKRGVGGNPSCVPPRVSGDASELARTFRILAVRRKAPSGASIPRTEFKYIAIGNRFRDSSVQLLESRTQGRDRAGIERLHPTESVAKILEQVITVLDASSRLSEKQLVLVRTTRLQPIESLHQHVDRETADPQVSGEME
jgi:hypothetical protein